MIMIVKTPGSPKGSPVVAEEGAEGQGGGRGEGGKRRRAQARSTLESTAPKARSRSSEGVSLNEARRILPRMSSKLPSLASLSLLSVITALARTSACLSATTTFSRVLACSLSTSKPDEGRRAEGIKEALQYDAWLYVGR